MFLLSIRREFWNSSTTTFGTRLSTLAVGGATFGTEPYINIKRVKRILYISKSSRFSVVVVQGNVDITDRPVLAEHTAQVFGSKEQTPKVRISPQNCPQKITQGYLVSR